MRTEADLRAALVAREAMSPDPDAVLAGVRETVVRRRRRTAGAVAAAAIAVAAAITLPVLVVRGGSETTGRGGIAAPTDQATSPPQFFRPDASGRMPFSFTVRPGQFAGFEFTPFAAEADSELWEVIMIGEDGPPASLNVYGPDSGIVFDDAEDVVSTEVGGAPAWFSAWPDESFLRWEYAPGAFAGIISRPAAAERELRAMAEAVEFGEPFMAKVPYRLDHLPAGMTPINVVQDIGDDEPTSVLQMEAGCSIFQLESAPVEDCRFMNIAIGEDEPIHADLESTTIAGHPARCTGLTGSTRCKVELDGLTVDIGGGTVDELARIVEGMTLAVWEDPTTWYDLDDALPLG